MAKNQSKTPKKSLAAKFKAREERDSKREYGRSWRSKKTTEGGKSLSVWLDPDTASKMDQLLDRYPRENKTSLVALAINALYKQGV